MTVDCWSSSNTLDTELADDDEVESNACIDLWAGESTDNRQDEIGDGGTDEIWVTEDEGPS